MDIEKELEAIQKRNRSVELDKAWERSYTRIALLCGITYISMTVLLTALQNSSPFLNALIPTFGYFLSTQSLPFVKKVWLNYKK